MNIISAAFIFVRNKSLPVMAALLFYVLPNIVQDVHRLSGHYEISNLSQSTLGKVIHQSVEKCLVCHFEFYSVDEIKTNIFNVVLVARISIIKAKVGNHLSPEAFDYSQLRAPPSV
jgi:hypothetical protein